MPEIPIDCLAFAEDLSALIDEELDAAREGEVRAHVEICEACAQRLQDLCNADLALADLASPALSGDLQARFHARLAGQSGDVPVARGPLRTPPRVRRRGLALGIAGGLAAAAAVALALLLGVPRDAGEPGVPIAREGAPEPIDPLDPRQAAEETIVQASQASAPAPSEEPSTQLAALDALPPEDAALLLDLDAVEDLDLIANLDLLEAMLDLGLTDGA